MQQNLKAALDWIIKAEGGYVNNPADPGGETNYGITKRFLGTTEEYSLYAVKDITEEIARAIYQKYFWGAMGCDALPGGLDLAVFDCAVNQGPGRARTFLSQCHNSALQFLKMRKDFYLSLASTEGLFEKGWMNRLFDLAWLIRPLVNN